LTLTVEQAGRALGIGRSTAYELVRSGEIAALRLRRRLVVPVAPLARQLGVTTDELWHAIDVG
jgi:excisionase family DNA binding protein